MNRWELSLDMAHAADLTDRLGEIAKSVAGMIATDDTRGQLIHQAIGGNYQRNTIADARAAIDRIESVRISDPANRPVSDAAVNQAIEVFTIIEQLAEALGWFLPNEEQAG